MEWNESMQRAIDYIENNLNEKLDYDEIARHAYCSSFHFQRVFGVMFGCTVGTYIRCRRMTLAAAELVSGKNKVIDTALKFGYENPDSFARAFYGFHHILPSEVAACGLIKAFPRFSPEVIQKGEMIMNCTIKNIGPLSFVGYKRYFSGTLENRKKQEEAFWLETRDKQDDLLSIREGEECWYSVSTNFTDSGFDQYIAIISGTDADGYDKIEFSAETYAVFRLEGCNNYSDCFFELRKRIFSQWLYSSGYVLAEGPEIQKIHWRKEPLRYTELWLPVCKKE